MVGRAKSDVAKRHTARAIHNTLMAWAIVAYKSDQKKPAKSRCGYQKICIEFEAIYFNETGKHIKLCHMTLKCLSDGGMSREWANTEQAWLLDSEADIVIDFIVEMAHWGFPLSHKRLKEHVDSICSACLSAEFPAKGVSLNWTYQFSQKHAERIKIS